MNPRIDEADLCYYQKEPDKNTPHSPSAPLKTSKSLRIIDNNHNNTLNYIPSLIIGTKTSCNLDKSSQYKSLTLKKNMTSNFKLSSSNSYDHILKRGSINNCANNFNANFNLKSPQNRKSKRTSPDKTKKKTLFEVLSNFYLTKKFINTLKSITSQRSPKFLSQNHFNIINDLAFFFDIWKQDELKNNEKLQGENNYSNFLTQKTLIIEKIGNKTKQFFKNFRIFDNSSSFMIFWNIIHLAFILFFFFTIPLEACFDVKLYQEYQIVYYIQYVAGYFFLGDIIVNCNTAVYLKGKLIKQRHKIMKNYVKTSFLKDIISIISIFLQLYKETSGDLMDNFLLINVFRVLFFLRMINFSLIIKRLEEMFFIDQSVHNILSLFKLIFRIILLSHIFACLWFYVGTLHTENSWIVHNDIFNDVWWSKYLHSYYFVCITMNTVGYGDITPQNSIEMIFTIIFIYIACGIFAYSINSIGVIVSEIARRENEFQKDLNIINEFMKQKIINFDLRMRVRKYLEYIWYEEKIEKLEEQSRIIDKLSDSLKEELLLEANGAIIRDLKMFTFNFSEELLRNTIPLLKEVRYTPGDLIFMKGNTDNKALYIIRKGKVEIFLETNKVNTPVTVLKTIEKGEIFGEISFFSDQERCACARSIDFTTAYMIKKEDFMNLLRKYPKDYQKFCEIKDSINFYEDYKDLYIKCYTCHEITHLSQNCPNIKYKPIKDVLLHRYFISVDQKRVERIRKNRKFKAIKFQGIVEKKAFEIQATIFPIHESERSSKGISDYSAQMEGSEDTFENSSFDEEKIIEEENEDGSGVTIKETKENENTFQDSFDNVDEVKPADQMLKIQRRNTKTKYFMVGESKNCIRGKSGTKYSKILDNLENEVYNALVMESSTSLNSLSHRQKNEDNTNSGSLRAVKALNGVNKLKSLLNYITELKENSKFEIKDIRHEITNKPMQKEDLKEVSQKDKESYLPCIDLIKSWDFYFSYNNSEKIIENCNLINKKRSRINKHHSTKSLLVSPDKKPNQCVTSRRQGILDKSNFNLDKIPQTPNVRLNGNSFMKKNFFQSTHVMEKFMKETQFDPEKFKKEYKKIYEISKLKLFLSNIFQKLFGWMRGNTKKTTRLRQPKRRIWKENKLTIIKKNNV